MNESTDNTVNHMSDVQLQQQLFNGATAQGIVLHDKEIELLINFLDLLIKWNRTYNLTALREPQEMVTKHLLDSLSVAPHIKGARVVDVGSGAGLPGLPLAIVFPEREFLLLDSGGKKTRFMQHAAQTLGLSNVQVEQSRAEDYHPAEGFATVISRAFASLQDFVTSSAHLCANDAIMLAMKGAYPQAEIDALPPYIKVDQVTPLVVADLDAERHVVVMHKTEN